MSFLQPLLLVALPLVAIPLIIHLINQRRYQTMRWAAMMFLLAANRMSRGYAKLRQWLILLFRMAVIAALVLAVSRPLASGWVGLAAGGKADTTLILIDRSPSMQQTEVGATASKLDTAVRQLSTALTTLGSSRWVLIDSVNCQPTELESPAALLNSPSATGASASADLPAMLQAAYDYIQANKLGRTEIWICSDLRSNDWNAQSGRWDSLRDAFLEMKQAARFHLLAFPNTASGNTSVRITSLRRQATSDGAELLVSLHLAREGSGDEKVTVPLQFDIDGARSELAVDMAGPSFDLKNHSIPLAADHTHGFGKVSIPADVNPADNEFYFAYDVPPPRHTVIVADDPQSIRAQQLIAEIKYDSSVEATTEIIGPGDLSNVAWEKVALLLWQSQLPQGEAADTIRAFVARSGQAMFFPPASPDATDFYGVRWQAWESPAEEVSIETWRGDQDVLSHTQSGAALPVGDLHVRRFCRLDGNVTPLATLHGGAPLLARVTTDKGGVYFWGTTAAPADSSLATDGVVLFVGIQRALDAGTEVLGTTRQITAGEMTAVADHPWKRLLGADDAVSTEYPSHSGVYRVDEKTFAVNRSNAEDQSSVLSDAKVAELFHGLDFVSVNDRAGGSNSLMNEIWRIFLVMMMVAMICEAALCLPKLRRATPAASSMQFAASSHSSAGRS